MTSWNESRLRSSEANGMKLAWKSIWSPADRADRSRHGSPPSPPRARHRLFHLDYGGRLQHRRDPRARPRALTARRRRRYPADGLCRRAARELGRSPSCQQCRTTSATFRGLHEEESPDRLRAPQGMDLHGPGLPGDGARGQGGIKTWHRSVALRAGERALLRRQAAIMASRARWRGATPQESASTHRAGPLRSPTTAT